MKLLLELSLKHRTEVVGIDQEQNRNNAEQQESHENSDSDEELPRHIASFLYFAKVNRRPVLNRASFFFRPGTGLLRKRSLTVNCQESHRRMDVTKVVSKLTR